MDSVEVLINLLDNALTKRLLSLTVMASGLFYVHKVLLEVYSSSFHKKKEMKNEKPANRRDGGSRCERRVSEHE